MHFAHFPHFNRVPLPHHCCTNTRLAYNSVTGCATVATLNLHTQPPALVQPARLSASPAPTRHQSNHPHRRSHPAAIPTTRLSRRGGHAAAASFIWTCPGSWACRSTTRGGCGAGGAGKGRRCPAPTAAAPPQCPGRSEPQEESSDDRVQPNVTAPGVGAVVTVHGRRCVSRHGVVMHAALVHIGCLRTCPAAMHGFLMGLGSASASSGNIIRCEQQVHAAHRTTCIFTHLPVEAPVATQLQADLLHVALVQVLACGGARGPKSDQPKCIPYCTTAPMFGWNRTVPPCPPVRSRGHRSGRLPVRWPGPLLTATRVAHTARYCICPSPQHAV